MELATKNNEFPGAQYRSAEIETRAIDGDKRTVELSFSSEEPYDRWFGTEILDHNPASVRLGRLKSGRHPLLVDHSTKDHVGVVERAWIGEDRIGRAVVRFGKSARAEEIFQDVRDGIRTLVSVGYRIHNMVLQSKGDDGEVYRVDDWEPFEVSLVSVPADATVGVGRDADEDRLVIRSLIQRAREASKMDEELKDKDKQPSNDSDVRVIDRDKERKDATAAERARVREINALAEKFGCRELAAKAVEDGTPYDAFREQVFDKLQAAGKLKLAESGEIGMSRSEVEGFRFTRLIAAAMFPGDASVTKICGLEIAAARAAADKRETVAKERDGAFTIPPDVLMAPIARLTEAEAARAAQMLIARAQSAARALIGQRALNVGTTTAGGHLVATELLAQSFIDLLVNQMVVMQMGTTMLTDLQGNVAIPRQTGGATGFWVAENTAPTGSQQAFDQVALTPKTVGAFTDYSRRLLLQSSIAVEAFVRMDLARTIALAIDLAAINGSGASNQPRGVLNTSGIGSVAGGANGAAPTWDNVVDLQTAVANANADIGALAYLTNSKVRGKLKRTQMFGGTNGMPVWANDGTLNGERAFVSNQVPSNLTKGTSTGVCSAIAYGNWRDLIVALWGGLDVMQDPYTGATAGTRRVVALQDVDVSVRHAESFAAMLDALTV